MCKADACPDRAVSRGFCNRHYQRWYKYGDESVLKRIHGDDEARFWSKVDRQPDGCWLWTDAINPRTGYAQVRMGGRGGRMVLVHRWSYEHLVAPIPRGLQLDHLCRVRHCVNPDHLEPVTAQENRRRQPCYVAAREVTGE